jgi:hypothetical protein
MWDGIEAKCGVFDVNIIELYVMEQFYDYIMIDDYSIVKQAHEIYKVMKELKNFGLFVPG